MQPPQRKEHISNALAALDLFFQMLAIIEDCLLSGHENSSGCSSNVRTFKLMIN